VLLVIAKVELASAIFPLKGRAQFSCRTDKTLQFIFSTGFNRHCLCDRPKGRRLERIKDHPEIIFTAVCLSLRKADLRLGTLSYLPFEKTGVL
jgi:hypothetical protein